MTKLIVEFSGLCYFLRSKDGKRIAVLMPDGREPGDVDFPDANAPVPPDERKKPSSHVGYIRCDLADILAAAEFEAGKPQTRIQQAAPEMKDKSAYDPAYELIHQFTGDLLSFGLSDDAMTVTKFEVPRFDCFASGVTLRRDVFGSSPKHLLMRTVISGGTFEAAEGKHHWDFVDPFGKVGTQCGGDFANRATWTREIPDGDPLVLTLTDFGGGTTKASVRLKPAANSTIRLKIANLCSDNPIEWHVFGGAKVFKGRRDEDFKWFYKLMEPKDNKTWDDLLKGARLPVPALDRRSGIRIKGEPPGCTPGGGEDGEGIF